MTLDVACPNGGPRGCRAESDHDWIENSHASTALSYADGLAKAFGLRGLARRRVIAVVGDGALTGGMCWEALDNIAGSQRQVIIVLNDNSRSYDPTAGAVAAHLGGLRANGAGQGHAFGHRAKCLFENLGIAYLGPVDGHHIGSLEHALRSAAAQHRPVPVHTVTAKGKGHPVTGGLGGRISEALTRAGAAAHVHGLGLPGCFYPHGDRAAMLAKHRLDSAGITAAVLAYRQKAPEAGTL